MCFGASAPSLPPTPAPAPAPPPMLPDQGVQSAGQDMRNRAALAFGAGQTILTGPQGLQAKADTTANSAMKTLLGG